jgi:hypothetical protein
LIFQRPKNPKNLKKPVWRYIRGTRKTTKLVSTHQDLTQRITEKKLKSSCFCGSVHVNRIAHRSSAGLKHRQ